ncbi:MAG: aminoacyl--tRNA ligase-related protein [bacterium]
MRYSQLFGKTTKNIPKDEISLNAKLLIQAGYIDKLMSGSYTLLPLGRLVELKLEKIVREEINKIDGEEVLMPLLHPKNIWNETGRWDKAKDIMYQFEKNDKEYALSFTHEEIVLDLIRKHIQSYKDFPVKIYHFSTKFRNEPRAKSGILRCREFIMKDLYSAHLSEKELDAFYLQVSEAYKKIFEKLGLKTKLVESGGGVFTDQITHEFQVLNERGEDIVFHCEKCDFAQNKEIAKVKEEDKCPKCDGLIKVSNGIEVGNIFRFGTSYSEKMNVSVVDNKGQKQLVYLGSYGIGMTRLLGTLVEENYDDKGIIWPEIVSPFTAHLVGFDKEKGEKVYEELINSEIDVLYDDRGASPGEKLADCDLIGIPNRLVVSQKSGDKIELKKRTEDKTELLTIEGIINKLSS